MANKKVINATTTSRGDIKFKSKSEATMFDLLMQSGFSFKYEPNPIILQEGFYPNMWVEGQKWRSDKIRSITYTPDFIVEYPKLIVIIEVKGFITDRYPLKRKMLLKLIKDKLDKEVQCLFFEVHTKKDMIFCINQIKSIIEEYEHTSGEN